jgi:hypothetical protein
MVTSGLRLPGVNVLLGKPSANVNDGNNSNNNNFFM